MLSFRIIYHLPYKTPDENSFREAALTWSYNWKIQLVSSSDCYLDFFLILNICQEQQRWKQILRRQCCPDIIGPDISNTEENALFVLSPLCDIFLKWWELDDLILSKSPEHWKTNEEIGRFNFIRKTGVSWQIDPSKIPQVMESEWYQWGTSSDYAVKRTPCDSFSYTWYHRELNWSCQNEWLREAVSEGKSFVGTFFRHFLGQNLMAWKIQMELSCRWAQTNSWRGEKENSCLAKRQLAVRGKKQPHIIPLNSHLQNYAHICLNCPTVK